MKAVLWFIWQGLRVERRCSVWYEQSVKVATIG